MATDCPVLGWVWLPIRVRSAAEPGGYRRVERKACPECAKPGRPLRHADGSRSSVMAEHREEPT